MTDKAAERGADTGLGEQKGSRLMTFKAPRPQPWLIMALGPVNRVLMLGGIPGLRSVPLLNRVPGITGLTNITRLDFPEADRARLTAAVNAKTSAFITPNHPEFFTDWMLDKEIISRVAPLTACWATHGIVNGLGKWPQKFWLANNLIAQIPGDGGKAGRDYSVDWAAQGNGVLLHPEGQVGWHGNHLGPLFPGAVQMALEARERLTASGDDRPVYVAPVIWKLVFERDVAVGLHKEIDYIAGNLDLALSDKTSRSPAERLFELYRVLYVKDALPLGVVLDQSSGPLGMRDQFIAQVCQRLVDLVPDVPAEAQSDPAICLRLAGRWLRDEAVRQSDNGKAASTLAKVLRRVVRFNPDYYKADVLTQEDIAEHLKRIRSDYCSATWRDRLHVLLPLPVGPRVAHIRVPDPLSVEGNDSCDALVGELTKTMQDALDEIVSDVNASRVTPVYKNPFVV